MLATVVLLALVFPSARVNSRTLGFRRQRNVLSASLFPGADAGARISAAIAALPAGGGTVDAQTLTGNQTSSTDLVLGSNGKPVKLVLGAMTLNMGNHQIKLAHGAHIIGQGYSGASPSEIDYSGPGTAILFGGASGSLDDVKIEGVRVVQKGAAGTGTGLSLNGIYRAVVADNSFVNFRIGVDASGADPHPLGSYFNVIRENFFKGEQIGIRFNGGGGEAANRNSVRDNQFGLSQQCIVAEAGAAVADDIIEGNDCENHYTPGTLPAIEWYGDASIIEGNWVEGYVSGTDIDTSGSTDGGNVLLSNHYGDAATRLKYKNSDYVIEPQLQLTVIPKSNNTPTMSLTNPQFSASLALKGTGDAGNASLLDNGSNGTVIWENPTNRFAVWNNGGAPVFTLDGGNGTFSGAVQVGGPPGPTWTSGLAYPSGPCRTGSLYTRTSGGPGSTLFVCQSGRWAPK